MSNFEFTQQNLAKSFFEETCLRLMAECSRLKEMNDQMQTALQREASPTASTRSAFTPQERPAQGPFTVGDLVSIKRSHGYIAGVNIVVAVLPDGKYRVRYYNGRYTTKARHELVSGVAIGDDVVVTASTGLDSTESEYAQVVKLRRGANRFTGLRKGTRGKVVSYDVDVRQLFAKPEGVNLSGEWLDAQGEQMGYAIIRVEDGYYTNQYAVPMHQLRTVANTRTEERRSRTSSPRVEPPKGRVFASIPSQFPADFPVAVQSSLRATAPTFVSGTFHAEEIEELVSGDDSSTTDHEDETSSDESEETEDDIDQDLVNELTVLVRAIKDTFGGEDAPCWSDISASSDY